MHCPYCHAPMTKKPEHNLNPRQKNIFWAVVNAGPAGIKVMDFCNEFFPTVNSPVTVRTTLYRINRKIKPMKIVSQRSGTYRLE